MMNLKIHHDRPGPDAREPDGDSGGQGEQLLGRPGPPRAQVLAIMITSGRYESESESPAGESAGDHDHDPSLGTRKQLSLLP
jgi:hypothetical protein